MANDAKRTSQLGIATTLAATDRVVVLTNPASSAQTQTITVSNLVSVTANLLPIANSSTLGLIQAGPGISIAANGQLTAPMPLANSSAVGVVRVGNNLTVNTSGTISVSIPGPYLNDIAASIGSVPIGGLYYNNSGTVQVRLT